MSSSAGPPAPAAGPSSSSAAAWSALCSAYYASRAGHRVTVIDRGGPSRDCCSFGNAGLVVPSHFVPLAAPGMVGMALRMMLDPASPFYVRPRLSAELLEWAWLFFRAATAERRRARRPAPARPEPGDPRVLRRTGRRLDADFGFERNGLLMLCRSEETMADERRTARLARELGMPADVLDANSRRPGARRPDGRRGRRLFSADCHLHLRSSWGRCRITWSEPASASSGTTEVTGWRASGAKAAAVRTSGGDFVADEFVLAGGSWSPPVARGLGLKLPLQAGKGYSLTLERPRRLPRIPAILVEARVAVTPMGGALRFGGTMELGGLDHEVSPARVRGIVESACRYLPDFTPDDFAGVPAWHGLRPCSPDGLPYLGRSRRCENVIVATGHAMMGLSLGPITGRLVAEILSGPSAVTEHRPIGSRPVWVSGLPSHESRGTHANENAAARCGVCSDPARWFHAGIRPAAVAHLRGRRERASMCPAADSSVSPTAAR